MHDFLLAKEIVDELRRILLEKKLEKIKIVRIEIGQVAMSHDGHPEHLEDISAENLEFSLKNIAQNTPFAGAKFEIKKVSGQNWKITDIEI